MTTKISELPTGQKVGNILNETLNVGGAATTATIPTTTIPRASAATSTVQPVLRLKHTTSGTPAAGIGASMEFEVQTSAGNNEVGFQIAAITTDVTAASEDFNLVFSGMQAGSSLRDAATLTGRGVLRAYFVGGESVSIGDSVSVFNVAGELVGYLTGTMRLASGGQYVFTADANDAFSNVDPGIGRQSAGVLKFTNGGSTCRGFAGGGAAIASAATLPVPTGSVCHVTGTTGITSITTTGLGSGVQFTLIFDGALTVTDGGNLKLAGNFTTSADDTLTLVFDGTNFYEIARSVN
jgi:hypothetical protein